VEVLLLDTEYALHRDDESAARASLAAALEQGAALDVVRPFAFAGPGTQQLLDSWAGGDFLARVAAARAAIDSTPTPMLTEREAAVLALLPTLLTASEIADEFTVSVNTVKSHIRSIYAKLDAPTRRDAVARAVERGLLP
jgi:LuxR family maltose regulon positive regulatory protein